MSDFNKRWSRCAAKAREAGLRDSSTPVGFATRVLAARQPAPESGLELIWSRWAWRSLAGVAAGLVVCAALELPHLRDQHPFSPGVENTVAQLLWRL